MRKFGATFGRSGNRLNKQGIFWWLAFLDTYRTLCLAPTPEIREIFEQLTGGDDCRSSFFSPSKSDLVG
jgi:hypothetical protein